jgi:hypothetical protein
LTVGADAGGIVVGGAGNETRTERAQTPREKSRSIWARTNLWV